MRDKRLCVQFSRYRRACSNPYNILHHALYNSGVRKNNRKWYVLVLIYEKASRNSTLRRYPNAKNTIRVQGWGRLGAHTGKLAV